MKADLHIHSSYSNDGTASPRDIVKIAKEAGLGCISITDHNSFAAFEEIKDAEGIVVIPGEEISSKDGHILAYGIDRHIPSGMSVKDTIDAIHAAGGIAIAPHPYRFWSGIGEKNVIGEFDGVEALNGRSTPNINRKSRKLARRFGKAVTVGSDAHNPRHIGRSYIVLPDCGDWHEAIDEIVKGNHEIRSDDRHIADSFLYSFKCVALWFMRGFKKI